MHTNAAFPRHFNSSPVLSLQTGKSFLFPLIQTSSSLKFIPLSILSTIIFRRRRNKRRRPFYSSFSSACFLCFGERLRIELSSSRLNLKHR
ncbi:hypothetical protein GBA52_018599 [Prunus armeniaca]|nr:hypothetical protein GBA52_018599 [Prunus armeniaca]